MAQQFTPGLFDRLSDDGGRPGPAGASPTWTLEQLKDAVARDLEALLNTRTAIADHVLLPFPESGNSLVNYGLIDFAGMCMASEDDRRSICAAVKRAIERHEPRLHTVSAALRVHGAGLNRVDFVITAMLKVQSAVAPVHFDAVLEPSTQQYLIRKVDSHHKDAA